LYSVKDDAGKCIEMLWKYDAGRCIEMPRSNNLNNGFRRRRFKGGKVAMKGRKKEKKVPELLQRAEHRSNDEEEDPLR